MWRQCRIVLVTLVYMRNNGKYQPPGLTLLSIYSMAHALIYRLDKKCCFIISLRFAFDDSPTAGMPSVRLQTNIPHWPGTWQTPGGGGGGKHPYICFSLSFDTCMTPIVHGGTNVDSF